MPRGHLEEWKELQGRTKDISENRMEPEVELYQGVDRNRQEAARLIWAQSEPELLKD